MRILFLAKQTYMRRDVIRDRYGRLYQIPSRLAAEGAQVEAILASYRIGSPQRAALDQDGVRWKSYAVPMSFGAYRNAVRMAAQDADVIIASSDCFQVAMGGWAAAGSGKPFVADLYDNYESFGMARLPFIRRSYLRGLRAADLVSCNGNMLAQYASEQAPGVDTLVLRSTIEANAFPSRARERSRRALGLVADRKLVGVAGGLTANRGIGFVYQACQNLNRRGFGVDLVLAGGRDRQWPIPTDSWVRYLGDLPHEAMVDFYNAMDVNVIQVQDDEFGRYCFPQKAEEILATRSPFVAADVGETARVLRRYPEVLFDPANVEQIEEAIHTQIESPAAVSIDIETWTDSVHRLYGQLEKLCSTGERTTG